MTSSPPLAEKPPTTPKKRPEICGPHAPERPYPIYLRGQVEKGFGRGSKDLGCPTANLPSKVVGPGSLLTRTGVYFGFARVLPQDPDDPSLTDSEVDQPSQPNSISTAIATSAAAKTETETETTTPAQAAASTLQDDDENEVVLGASPVGDPNENFPHTKLRQARVDNKESAKVSLMTLSHESHSILSSPSASNPAPASSSPTQALAPGSAPGSGFKNNRQQRKKRVHLAHQDSKVFPMVMSVGWNPFYKNTFKTAEVHVLHNFADDFYGLEIRVVVLGYIRPEYNYDTMQALIDDIEMDKKVTINSLSRPLYQDYSRDPFLGRMPDHQES